MPQLACEAFATFEQFLERPCACAFSDNDADRIFIEGLLDDASDVLYTLSGGKVHGRCTKIVRPCRSDCSCGRSYGACGSGACCSIDTVPLRGPNTDVISVRIDGDYLDSSSYGLMDGGLLYRSSSDGTQPDSWPGCQKLYLEATEEGTFEVVFRFGHAPDHLAASAAIELVCKWASGFDAAKERSKLPAGTVSANVGGVQARIRHRADEVAKDAGAAMPAVAEFLAVWAPDRGRNTGVWSPELDGGWTYHEMEGPSGS